MFVLPGAGSTEEEKDYAVGVSGAAAVRRQKEPRREDGFPSI